MGDGVNFIIQIFEQEKHRFTQILARLKPQRDSLRPNNIPKKSSKALSTQSVILRIR